MANKATGKWRFWVDRGGTFTDIVARTPEGRVRTAKLLSENPGLYIDAAIEGMRHLMAVAEGEPLPHKEIASVRMGTTVATNALLERKGERTLLMITAGFRDALRIGYQARPRLFDLDVKLPELIYDRVIEVEERVSAEGEILTPLDEAAAREALQAAHDDGIRSVAIVLMHGYRFTDHETRLGEIAEDIGFDQISLSHRVSPLMKLVGRGDTTCVDAYLSPILRRYVQQVRADLGSTPLFFMQSNGGLAEASRFEGKDAILSGPAGGVVGAVKVAKAAGFDRIIGFDMGGTSTDVTHYDGALERSFETEVAGVRMRVPMMHIHTVAAGGGSVLHFDGARFRAGPDSAGAYPGPACYRHDGPLTVTDCNLMLGRIQVDHFPRVFGPEGNQPLDRDSVAEHFKALAEEITAATGDAHSPETVAEGFLAVAVENMARAIKKISVERGYDVSKYCLVSFGGAGGQHALKVADQLGIETVLLHPLAGVLSAYGIGLSEIRAMEEQAIEAELGPDMKGDLDDTVSDLTRKTFGALLEQGVAKSDIQIEAMLRVRYQGTDTALLVHHNKIDNIRLAFEAAHRRQFGFADPDRPLIIEAAIVEAMGGGAPVEDLGLEARAIDTSGEARMWVDGAWQTVPVLDRGALEVGDPVSGPALILEPHGTNVIEAGWQAVLRDGGALVMTRHEVRPAPNAGTEADPVMLEIFNNLFMSVAEQMGGALENTAHSVNMKERLDFSCALFDGQGRLIANAPHMPVHLGSMGLTVQTVITRNAGQIQPGDVYVINDPYNGGTHLPDITVVTPVFLKDEDSPLFYVAARGHHADIGGITPGSMPPNSRTIDEEGVLFDNVLLMRDGDFRETEIRQILTGGAHPARNPDQNIADLKAQVAAMELGGREIRRMVDQFGRDVVAAYMGHVRQNAADAVRRVIDVLADADYTLALDTGGKIRVSIKVDRENRRATVDFTGTSDQEASNFNAPAAVTTAAVLYVFRCLVADDIPLNDGCLEPLDIIIPEGSILNPRHPAAVAAGNVETSQVVVNALLLALGVTGAAQGTMNNLTFGNDRWQYYETIGGGMGAGDGFNGATGIQCHMTNSRLTDPEVLEFRFPVLVKNFAIRQGSGGRGKWRGGNGLVRALEFREAMTAGVLTNSRKVAPPGQDGGEAGRLGKNRLIRAGGSSEDLPHKAVIEVRPGDVLEMETPGGGGFGKPDPEDPLGK
jgi:5-oxoprolinase (ATP-hydrolysing)